MRKSFSSDFRLLQSPFIGLITSLPFFNIRQPNLLLALSSSIGPLLSYVVLACVWFEGNWVMLDQTLFLEVFVLDSKLRVVFILVGKMPLICGFV